MSDSESTTSISIFTPAELDYLKTQRLARIATADASGQPHVTPVTFRYNPETDTFDVSGRGGFATRKKWRDAEQNPHIALVIDDVIPEPWTARGIEIRGTVELKSTGGETIFPGCDAEMFHITPKRIISWGIDTAAYAPPNARSVN
jgi:pyridoxamine 5'-phosphate oxidase family protein